MKIQAWHWIAAALIVLAAIYLKAYKSKLSADAFEDSTTGIRVSADVLKVTAGMALLGGF